MTQTTKTCSKCGMVKPLCDFWNRGKGMRHRLSKCKECKRKDDRKYRDAHCEQLKQYYRIRYATRPHAFNRHIRNKYGLTPEAYSALLNSQGGLCAICGCEPNGRKHVVDHDHASGIVRGLLCPECNRMLGCAKDNPETLESAARYLASRKSRSKSSGRSG